MPKVWIESIQAPEHVFISSPFQVSWGVYFRGIPKKYKLISRIAWDNKTYEKVYIVRACIIKKKITTHIMIPGIEKTTTFTISVGWRE